MKRRASAECTRGLANIKPNLDMHAAFTNVLRGHLVQQDPYALIVRTCFSIQWERVYQHRQEAFLAAARIQDCVPAVSAPKVTPARQHGCWEEYLADEERRFWQTQWQTHCLKHSPPPQMDADLGGAPSCEVLAGGGVGSSSSGRSKASTRGTGG